MRERNDELTRLSYTLGENREDRFYVYMLSDDNGKPFYIGKGQGGRVFCHENDVDKLLEVIRSENGDRNVDYSQLSEKIKTIRLCTRKNVPAYKGKILWFCKLV